MDSKKKELADHVRIRNLLADWMELNCVEPRRFLSVVHDIALKMFAHDKNSSEKYVVFLDKIVKHLKSKTWED